MGIFGSIFKNKVKWDLDELKALYFLGFVVAGIDRNLEKSELNILVSSITSLPGGEMFDPSIAVEAMKQDPSEPIRILKKMHPKKKNIARDVLLFVSLVDGKLTEDEKEIINTCTEALGLDKLEDSKVDKLIQNSELQPSDEIKEGLKNYKLNNDLPPKIKNNLSSSNSDNEFVFKKDITGLMAYFKERPNIGRLYDELTWSIRHNLRVEEYLKKANIMHDDELKRIVAIGFNDILTFLEEMLKMNENEEMRKDYNALKESILILTNN